MFAKNKKINMRISKSTKATPYDRVQYLLQYWGINEEEFLSAGICTIAELDKAKNDPSYVSQDLLKAVIQKDPNISPDWFLFNKGKMLNVDTSREIDDYTDINTRVKELRLKHMLGQAEMSEVLGCARSTYANIEHNNQTVSFKHLRLLRQKFKISYDYILDGVEVTDANAELDRLKVRVVQMDDYINTLKKSNDALVSAISTLTVNRQ
jgi:transcriptional regulator with XRE-family HTH domain